MESEKNNEDHFYMNAKYSFELDQKEENLGISDAAVISTETKSGSSTSNNKEISQDVGDESVPNYYTNKLYDY